MLAHARVDNSFWNYSILLQEEGLSHEALLSCRHIKYVHSMATVATSNGIFASQVDSGRVDNLGLLVVYSTLPWGGGKNEITIKQRPTIQTVKLDT